MHDFRDRGTSSLTVLASESGVNDLYNSCGKDIRCTIVIPILCPLSNFATADDRTSYSPSMEWGGTELGWARRFETELQVGTSMHFDLK